MSSNKDLSALTREEKLKLIDALEERSRRDKLKLSSYVPNDGQIQVHKSNKKTRLVISGNGAGKTTMAVHEAVWAAQGYNPVSGVSTMVPRRVIVVLDKPEKIADKWWPEIKKWFDTEYWKPQKNGKPYISQIMLPNGSEIRFLFHEMEELSFESIEVDDVIADEPPPRKVYIALLRGMRNKDHEARMLIIGTPITGSWLRKELYEPWAEGDLPDTECFKFSTRSNEANLPPGYVEWYSSKLNEKERRVRIEGDFFDLDGLALSHLFKRPVHVLDRDKWEYDQGWPCVVAIDPHPSKKHVACLLSADPYGVVWVKELALKETPRVFARSLKKWMSGYRVIDIVCDNLGSSDMTGGEGFKSFIQVLVEEGIQVRPTTFHEKADEDWVNRIQDSLQIPESPNNFGMFVPYLRIVDGNPGIVTDIETVEWAKHRTLDDFKPTLSIERKDYLACLKYGLATNLSIKRKKDKVFYRNEGAYGFQPKHQATRAHQAAVKEGVRPSGKKSSMMSWARSKKAFDKW